jgi:hypothetical protein
VPSVRSLLDLRHDAILDLETTLAEKAKFGRISLKEAKKYMIDDPTGLRDALEKSHREFEAREGRAFVSVLVPIGAIRFVTPREATPDVAAAE